MSVDQELARAVEEAEAEGVPAVAQPSGETPPQEPRARKGNWGLLAALLVIVGGVLTLVFTSFEGSAIYSVGVEQLMKEKDRYGSRNLRVQGILVKGTLLRRDEPCEYKFKIARGGETLPVNLPHCNVPDTFRDMPGMDVEVTAEGKLGEGGQFVASSVMAKCPSKYEMKEKAASGEAAPHLGAAASPLQTLSQKE
jgi:cytochrome c-type biogenesis protein CcmE